MTAARNQEAFELPHARFEVTEMRGRSRRGTIRCVINHHVMIDPEALSSYCFRELSARVDDLVLIAAGIAFADRTLARRPALTWRRRLELTIPVREVDFWKQDHISRALTDLIELLTGDTWIVQFRNRQLPTPTHVQSPLSLSHGVKPIVMPFSDGLDSLAGARLVAATECDAPLLLVTAGHRHDADRPWRERHMSARRYRLVVPFQFPNSQTGHRFRESSFRSRALVYGVMAGIAAHLSGGERVIYAESGQGALGPWLMPVGNEAPDVRMHPLFTQRLGIFLKTALGTPVLFEHPRLWHTKGETLNELVHLGRADDWHRTRSCARDARHMSVGGQLMQCGVCSNCLLRRQSLLAAGLDEHLEHSPYFWRKLKAHSLDTATSSTDRATSLDDTRQAICGFLSLAQLADLAEPSLRPLSQPALTRELAEVLNETEESVNPKMQHLLSTHRTEWLNFLDRLGSESFLNRWMAERR
jgi:7-cyano-7-deazaguanine synthase in queuosine biosynthesis